VASLWAFDHVQSSATQVDLVSIEEEWRIRNLWAANTWPNKWDGTEVDGDVALDAISVDAFGDIVSQPLLVQ